MMTEEHKFDKGPKLHLKSHPFHVEQIELNNEDKK